MKRLLFAAALVLPAMATAGATSTDLDRLNVFAGMWQSQSETYATPYSSAGQVNSTLVNQCWKAGGFFVCNQSVNGVSRVLLVFAYQDGDSYSVTYVPAGGGHSISGTVLVDGGVWTFPGEQHKYGQVVYFRTVNIYRNNDSLDFREEYSTDNKTWTVMSKGHETRVRS